MREKKFSVLRTGANGLIGNLVYTHLDSQPNKYTVYGNARRAQPSNRVNMTKYTPIPDDRMRLGDLTDFTAMQRAVEGIDVVVHMAADASGRLGWESIHENNIQGTYNVFEASRLAGVKRIIFASTNQVVFGYMRDEPYTALFEQDLDNVNPDDFPSVDFTQPTKPLNYYACSKVFGEALSHMYAHSHQMSCLNLRIGWVTHDDQLPHPRARVLWCSQRDIIQIVELCILAPEDLRYDVFHGQSENTYNFLDIQHTIDVLGYQPQDNAEVRLKNPSDYQYRGGIP